MKLSSKIFHLLGFFHWRVSTSFFFFFTPVYRPYTELNRASNDASIEASFCILNQVCSLHFKPNLQSTVCSLHFILSDSEKYSLSYSVSHFVHLLSSELSVITSMIPNLSVKRKWVSLWWFLALVLRSMMMFMDLFFNYLFKSKFGKLQSNLTLKKILIPDIADWKHFACVIVTLMSIDMIRWKNVWGKMHKTAWGSLRWYWSFMKLFADSNINKFLAHMVMMNRSYFARFSREKNIPFSISEARLLN